MWWAIDPVAPLRKLLIITIRSSGLVLAYDISITRISSMATSAGVSYKYFPDLGFTQHFREQDNILVSGKGQAIVADFGISRDVTSAFLSAPSSLGNPRWMAPELLEENAMPTMESDVWGCGMSILVVALVPFLQKIIKTNRSSGGIRFHTQINQITLPFSKHIKVSYRSRRKLIYMICGPLSNIVAARTRFRGTPCESSPKKLD